MEFLNMSNFKLILVSSMLFFSISLTAEIIGDFSRANCVTNNESITLDIRYENIDGSNIIIDIIKDIDSLLEKIIENRLKCN